MFKRKEKSISTHMPFVAHVSNTVVLMEDSGIFSMFELEGLPWQTSDEQDVSSRQVRLNHTYRSIADSSVIITVYQCRVLASPDIYPKGTFRSAFAESLDTGYRAKLFDDALYNNRIFMAVHVRPARFAGEFVGEQMAKRSKGAEEAPEVRSRRLEEKCAQLEVELAAYKPRRLGLIERNGAMFSEITEAIVLAMTGKWRPIGLTTGRLGDAMFSERIIVGSEAIEYRLPGESWFGAAFGMKHYPYQTYPGQFGSFLSANYMSTLVHSYRFVPTQTAQGIMKRKRVKMLASEDESESQVLLLKEAADQLGSSNWVMGDYCLTLLVFARSPEALKDVATAAWGDLASAGAVVAREGAALEAALLSVCVGNSRFRPRPGYLSSRNMASMAPLHSFPTGEKAGYWGEPVALFRTTGGTGYRHHFHVGDVGNTFLTGRVGSGKSVWLAFMCAQAERLGATVVLFDKDRGLKILTHALGGRYLELKSPTGLAPLKALTNSDADRTFLIDLIRGLIATHPGSTAEVAMTPEEERRLNLAVKIVMSLPPAKRSMSEIKAFLGVGENGAGARLAKWCHGNELGWIVDCEQDEIRLDAPVLGFDQTFILDNPMARGPVLATLFYRVEALIDGRNLLFVIDEFWKSLLDPAFRDLVNDKLKTLRKRNSPMILATQSPRDALESVIGHTIKEQCPSQIYFSNGQATWEDFGERGMGLTRAEFDIVRNLPEGQGTFLLKQGKHSVVAQLPLRGMPDEMSVLSGRESTTRIFDRVRAEVGEDPVTVVKAFYAARKEMAG